MKEKKSISIIVGSNIKKYRKEKGLYQKDIAKLCDISIAYISKIEKGNANISIDTLEKIAKALNVSVDKLVTDKND